MGPKRTLTNLIAREQLDEVYSDVIQSRTCELEEVAESLNIN